ncbi:MAG: hypothetical protein GX781_08895 [Clostridiales bacterium]|nr:hypothetical protein [Clostridiales bacterium]
MKKNLKLFVSLLLSLILLSSVTVWAEDQNIIDIASGNEDFSILVAALQQADLVDALSVEGPFTVFAPTNEAFKKLFNELKILPLDLINHPQLAEVLLYHVVPGKVLSTDLQDGMEAQTLGGHNITVDLRDGVKINQASVTAADIEASNGVIHVIDTVLVPETFQLVPAQTAQEAPAAQAAPVIEEPAVLEEAETPEAAQAAETDQDVAPQDETEQQPGTIVEVAAANKDFSILMLALQNAGLDQALQSEGPFTVFAPTDAAFMKLLGQLKVSPLDLVGHPQLTDVLLYHVVSGKIMSTDLQDRMEVDTLSGEKLTVHLAEGVKINDAAVMTADIPASNGVIHVIDSVLVPPTFELAPEQPDQVPEGAIEAAVQHPSIVEIAVSNPDFSTLAAAVQKAGLLEVIQGEGPFTVFAPTNAAFDKLLGELQISKLDLINHPQLKDVLLYHVLAGKIMSTDLQNGMEAQTLGGQNITVDFTDGIKVNDSTIVAADIEASNGVVHIIDTVLIPDSFQLVPSETAKEDEPAQQPEAIEPLPATVLDIALSSPDFTTLVAALQKADLVETLAGEGPFTVFAPTNAAFEKLLAELGITAEDLLNNPQLTDVLLYHVVPGMVLSTDLQDGMEAQTLGGQNITVDLKDGVKINGSAVTAADLKAGNGVIHVIDTVLIPEGFQLSQYRELTVGSEGDDVLKLKQRFVELGYYRDVKLSSRYTEKTSETVLRFEQDAGLPADGIADSQMQEVLYSDAAPRQH